MHTQDKQIISSKSRHAGLIHDSPRLPVDVSSGHDPRSVKANSGRVAELDELAAEVGLRVTVSAERPNVLVVIAGPGRRDVSVPLRTFRRH